jgi:hypothetical protein
LTGANALASAGSAVLASGVGSISLNWDYLDVPRLEQDLPANVPVVAGWQEDFVKLMCLAQNPEARYYFLLDWPWGISGTESVRARLPPHAGISQQRVLLEEHPGQP